MLTMLWAIRPVLIIYSSRNYALLDPDVNFSDHLPLKVTLSCSFLSNAKKERDVTSNSKSAAFDLYLRSDKADLNSLALKRDWLH